MEKFSAQQLNFEAFRCELRILPQIQLKHFQDYLDNFDRLTNEEKNNVGLHIFFDKKLDKKTRISKAISLWEKVKDSNSLLYIATAYFHLNKEDKAVEFLKESAKAGNPDAKLRIGYCNLLGVANITPNVEKAGKIFKKLAEEKLPDAVYFLGAIFMLNEDFVTPNPEKAKKLLLWSVKHGCKFALFEQGITLVRNEKTQKIGLDLIQQAAKKQEVRAMMWLSIELAKGILFPRDLKQSQNYFEQCCALNFKPALLAIKEAMASTNND